MPSSSADSPIWDAMQSPLGATVVGGLIVVFLAWVATVIVARARRVKYRDVVDGLGRWISGSQPVTMRRLKREVAAERAFAEKEHAQVLATQKKSPRPPAWRIRHDHYMGRDEHDNDAFWLTNMGYPVSEVEVVGDPDFIELPHRVVFMNAENGTGQWFSGNITDRGRQEGVTLTISHRNAYGELGSFDYRLGPGEIADMNIETRPEAYERGKADGALEGYEAGFAAGQQSLQLEIDTQRAKPIRKARWAAVRMPNGSWTLTNASDGAIATLVTLNAPPEEFTFFSAADWDSMSGVLSMPFEGMAIGAGGHVAFEVEWDDENGVHQSAPIHWYPPSSPAAGPVVVSSPPLPDF